MTGMLDKLIADLDATRAELHADNENEALRAFVRGEYETSDEALEDAQAPGPATRADAERYLAVLAASIEPTRAFVAQHEATWAPHVRARWLVSLEELEDRLSRYMAEVEEVRRAS